MSKSGHFLTFAEFPLTGFGISLLFLNFLFQGQRFAAFPRIWPFTILHLLPFNFADKFSNEQQILDLFIRVIQQRSREGIPLRVRRIFPGNRKIIFPKSTKSGHKE